MQPSTQRSKKRCGTGRHSTRSATCSSTNWPRGTTLISTSNSDGVQYIYATEQLHAAAVEADLRTRDELTDGLEHFMTKRNRPAAAVISGAALLALDIAIDRWQADNAKRPLADRIAESFDQLTQLAELT